MSTFERNCGSASSIATPLNQFGRDDAIWKITEECIRMQNLEIIGHQQHRTAMK
jgi:hypothetical protein